jgi:hypothetical protein
MFITYSNKLNILLQASKESDLSPAQYLYQNGARNVLFMLEGLTRIHKNAYKGTCGKWYSRFKEIEDLLGEIDYLDCFRKQFEKESTVGAEDIEKLNEKIRKTEEKLNTLLQDGGWLEEKLQKFDAYIENCNFKYGQKYRLKIKKAYRKEVKKCIAFAKKLDCTFHVLETELHEMRRKLRWLSIYAQALEGMFQLKTVQPTTLTTTTTSTSAANDQQPQASAIPYNGKYMTPEVINSPFNKMPPPIDNLPIIYLDYHAFIALSYIINQLGHLKDKGLKNIILREELKKSKIEVQNILGDRFVRDKDTLASASQILKTFIYDGVLEGLLATKK